MRIFQGGICSLLLVFLSLAWASSASGLDTVALTGRILDKSGAPVFGGEVYVFNSPRVKRPADFISTPTGPDGRFTLTLPVDTYWAVAVLRKSGKRFGPLEMGDKYSGEPVRLDLTDDGAPSLDFIVRDLRQAALQHDRKHADIVRVSGRIIDRNGKPVAFAYAAADRHDRPDIPEHISAWTDEQGRYTLYLPRGSFHVGAAREFPSAPGFFLARKYDVTEDTADLDIVLREEHGR